MGITKEIQNITYQNLIQNSIMAAVHFLALYSIISWNASYPLALVILAYSLRLFFVAAGNHRYFSHKSFILNRFFQFIFGLGSTLAMHNSIFWWASKHRKHHKYINHEDDPHSHKKGFYWSHIGWILDDDNQIDLITIKDLTEHKELNFLSNNHKLINISFAILLFLILGFKSFCSIYCLSLVLSWTTMFFVNSLGHKIGYQNHQIKDDSTNIPGFALISFGEGLHNNHHRNPYQPNNRVKWFEIDLTYIALYILSLIKIVKFRKKVS